MARQIQVESIPLSKIGGWLAGLAASVILLIVSFTVATISGQFKDLEKRVSALEVGKATADANYTQVKDALTKIEIKLDNIQTEMLLQRKK